MAGLWRTPPSKSAPSLAAVKFETPMCRHRPASTAASMAAQVSAMGMASSESMSSADSAYKDVGLKATGQCIR